MDIWRVCLHRGGIMRKTTIELTDEHYFYLQEKVLELKKRNESVSMASLIRNLIEKDRQTSMKKGKAGK
jgi:predicted CopG family antitoxin